jgi:hypothetical protein
MKELPASLALAEALAQADGITPVVNEQGMVIGYVMPPIYGSMVRHERETYYNHLKSRFSADQFDKEGKPEKFHTMDDVMGLFRRM